MSAIPIGLFLAFLLVLATVEPLAAGAVGLMAVLGYRWLDRIERRIRALEAVAPGTPAAQMQELFAEAASRVETPSQWPEPREHAPGPPAGGFGPVSAVAAPIPRRQALPEPTPAEPSVWERWSSASWGELEDLFAGRLLAVVGGIALFLGGVFFLGLAFSRGWIGPEMRVALGLVGGLTLFAIGGWLLRGPRMIVAHVLVAVGLGVFSVALFAATRLHGFITPELGVAAALMVAVAAAAVAIRFNSQLVAAFGLVAVLASPPIMGASASLVTMAFIGAALAGTTAIALYRSWRWLPALAFVLAAPQLASYLAGDPAIGIGLGALAGFWLLNAISAGGEEFRLRRYRLSATSATVLLANAAFTLAAGFGLLDGELERWRGLYLLVLALAHFALAAIFLIRESDRHPFGMLAAGTGIAAVTMAVPIQLGAMWVPLAWAAEAVALTWIAVERRHRYSAAVAAILGSMAAAHIVAIEYPRSWFATPAPGSVPFLNPSGLALAFVVAAAAVASWLLRNRREWIAVAAVAAGLVVIAIPHELDGWGEAMALTTLAAGLVCVQRAVLGIPLRPPASWPSSAFVERALYGAAAVAGAFTAVAFFDALTVSAVLDGLSSSEIPQPRPFLNEASTVAVIVAGGALSVAVVCAGLWLPAGLLTAAAAIAWLLPTQVGGAIAVAGWSALAIGLMVGSGRIGASLAWGARVLAALAALETVAIVAPVGNLVVSPTAAAELPILNGSLLATLAITAMLAARALLPPFDKERRSAAIAAGIFGVYAISIGLVDLFQVQVGGSIALEELQKQAQVALSVLWAIIGSVATVAGLGLGRGSLRLFGLALLGIVTLKVFIIDLAALDIAYRVLSFVALGVLLLVAAYLYGRLQPTKKSNTAAE